MAVLHTPVRTSQVNAQTTGLALSGPRGAFSASHVSQIRKPRFWLRVNSKSRRTNHAPVMPTVPARVAPWLRPLPAPNFDTYSSAVTCATHAPLDQSATSSCPRNATGSTGVVRILHKELCDLRSTLDRKHLLGIPARVYHSVLGWSGWHYRKALTWPISSMPPLDLGQYRRGPSEHWATACCNELCQCAVDLRPVTAKTKQTHTGLSLAMASAFDKSAALRALQPSLAGHSGPVRRRYGGRATYYSSSPSLECSWTAVTSGRIGFRFPSSPSAG
jgi:hypothetical protein